MVIVLQHIHDFVRPGSTVIDVTENMELVDGESLDDVGNGNNKGIGAPRVDDGVDNHVDICSLVRIFRALMEQFLDNV